MLSTAAIVDANDVSTLIEHQQDSGGGKGYQCRLCAKRYERLDHARRHLTSHSNTRPFACNECSRRFNRRDLLTRHQASHKPPVAARRVDKPRGERAAQACRTCVSAKARCDNSRPCQRCSTRGIPCLGPQSPKNGSVERNLNGPSFLPGGEQRRMQEWNDNSSSNDVTFEGVGEGFSDNTMPSLDFNSAAHTADSGQASNEQINPFLTNDYNNGIPNWDEMTMFPGDLTQIFFDVDFQFDDAFQGVASDTWTVGAGLNDDISGGSHGDVTAAIDSNTLKSVATTQKATVTPGYDAFKRSPWLWTPAVHDHAYAEHAQLAVNDDRHILASPEVTNDLAPSRAQLPNIQATTTRDHVLAMVLKHAKSGLHLSAFPSLSVLNVLMHAFLVREGATVEPIIHQPTFDPDKCRSELLGAMICAGATFFASPNTWKMGLALQEIVKLAICDALDNDNRLARELQTGQTFLLWIEVGLWSGFRRKMEIGEGFAHTVPTMLRRAGAFHSSHYSSVILPDIADQGDALEAKWRTWVEKESFKRLAFRVFINEMRCSMAFVRTPVFSLTDMTLALPISRSLWDAQNAQEWKVKASDIASTRRDSPLSLLDIMHDISQVELHQEEIDVQLSITAMLHALWMRVWALQNMKEFHKYDASGGKQSTSILWVDTQHNELYRSIQDTCHKIGKLDRATADAQLVAEFLMMSLHVNPEDIQRLAGRFGEEDFRKAAVALRSWLKSPDARHALWHAGQLLRAATSMPPTQLRGFYAVIVYHGCLTLWVTATLGDQSHQGSRASSTQPIFRERSVQGLCSKTEYVVLNQAESRQTRAYLATGQGIPALHVQGAVKDIRSADVIPTTMASLFRQNFPDRGSGLPPLLESLSSLMYDLCKGTNMNSSDGRLDITQGT